MARVFSEKAWHSTKVSNINPKEWRPEYAWLVAVAYVDGTFEADPQDIWARAYAYARPDWSAEKVAQLLNEFERVGLLQRTKDEEGRIWGFWTGADKFTPSPSQKSHYKAGKRSLFNDKSRANLAQASTDSRAGLEQAYTKSTAGLDYVKGELDSDSVCELVKESVSVLVPDATINSTTEQPKHVKSTEAGAEALSLGTVEPNPEDFSSRIEYSAACHKAGVLPKPRRALKNVLPREDFEAVKEQEKVAKAVAELAADMAAVKKAEAKQ
jgi:hypothetical protein